MRDRTPDLEVELRFLPTDEGGRMGPVVSGYRPDHDFGLLGSLVCAAHEYIGADSVSPGESVRAHLHLANPQFLMARLHEGLQFTVQEGARIVALGTVESVLNPMLKEPPNHSFQRTAFGGR